MHSPQVFRPRPLDIDTPMPVVIQSDPDDEEELKTDKKLFKKRDRIPIPIPVYTELENYEKENAEWKRPAGYVIYHEKSHSELEETVEYEMDSEDERFVHTINEASNKVKGRNQSSSSSRKQTSNLLTDDGFEKMIDVLEKEAFRKVHKIPSRSFLDYLESSPHKKKTTKPAITSALKDEIEAAQPADDVPCVICNDEDWDESNMIVFCDGCELAVHQTCYGIPQIPRADWYCKRCEFLGKNSKNSKEANKENDEAAANSAVREKEGEKEKEKEKEKEREEERERPTHRHKKTKGNGKGKGKSKDKQGGGGEEESESSKEGGKEFKCVLCGKEGGAIKNTVDGKWAHVMCALWIPDAAFLDATVMEPIDTSSISKDRFGLQCEICGTKEGCCIQCRTRYCYTAFHPFCASKAGLLMEMRTAKGRPNNLLFKTHCTVHSQEIRADRGLEAPDKYAGIINQVCTEEIKVGLHQLVEVPQAVADAVCNFWLTKRQKGKNKDRPLLSRLQMEEDALKHEQKKKRSAQRIQAGEEQTRLRELRRQMDRALIILDVLKKREMYKREYVRNLEEIFESMVLGNEYNFTGSSPRKTPKKILPPPTPTLTPTSSFSSSSSLSSSSSSVTSPVSSPFSSFPSSTTATLSLLTPIKKTPLKSTQLSLHSFFKNTNPINNINNINNSTTAVQSPISTQRKSKVSSPSNFPTTPRRLASPTHNNSSSDESLALPHAHTPDMATRKRAGSVTRSQSPAARRSLSPDLSRESSSESAESDSDSEHSSENEDMVPKSRAHLRRAAANFSNPESNAKNSKPVSPERTAISKRRKRV